MKSENQIPNKELLTLAIAVQSLAGGDRSFPRADAEDLARGARFIPGNVTMARRADGIVVFHHGCTSNCWYWESIDDTSREHGMRQGNREYHWCPSTADAIARANGVTITRSDHKVIYTKDGERVFSVGPCPYCGNKNTDGGSFVMYDGVLYKAGHPTQFNDLTVSVLRSEIEEALGLKYRECSIGLTVRKALRSDKREAHEAVSKLKRYRELHRQGFIWEAEYVSTATDMVYLVRATIAHTGRGPVQLEWFDSTGSERIEGYPEKGEMDAEVKKVEQQLRRSRFDDRVDYFDDFGRERPWFFDRGQRRRRGY